MIGGIRNDRISTDRDDRDRLIHDHLPLADRLARRFLRRGESFDDLVQVARLALVQAADRFEPDRGVFVAYASVTVTGALRRHLRDASRVVRVPRALDDLRRDAVAASESLRGELRREPTATEIAGYLGRTVRDVEEALNVAFNATIDLDGMSAERPLDVVEAAVDDLDELVRLLYGLPPQARRVLYLRFFHHRTDEEIADQLGISDRHVRRVLRRSLDALRPRTVDA